jgi:hypothetical protein
MKKNSREAEWKQKPEQTVGVDLGDRFSRYCVLDQEGAVIEEGRVRTDREAWRQHWEGEPRQRVVMETGTHSPWASRLLQELGHQVIVANAREHDGGCGLVGNRFFPASVFCNSRRAMIYPDSLTSRVPATAISGLALRGRASDSSAFSSVSDTKMHRAF